MFIDTHTAIKPGSKPLFINRSLTKLPKNVFKTDKRLMNIKSSILQYF